MTRMYKKGSNDSSESEENQDETDNSNFEETLYKSVAEAVAPVKRQPSDHDGYKSLSREPEKSQNARISYSTLDDF